MTLKQIRSKNILYIGQRKFITRETVLEYAQMVFAEYVKHCKLAAKEINRGLYIVLQL